MFGPLQAGVHTVLLLVRMLLEHNYLFDTSPGLLFTGHEAAAAMHSCLRLLESVKTLRDSLQFMLDRCMIISLSHSIQNLYDCSKIKCEGFRFL